MTIDRNVLTPLGWRDLSLLQPGDLIIDAEGCAVPIAAVHQTAAQELYKLTAADDSEIVVGEDEIIPVHIRSKGQSRLRYKTVAEMYGNVTKPRANGNPTYRYTLLPFKGLAGSIQVDYAYALGYCLGNGCFSKALLAVSFHADIKDCMLKSLEPSLGLPNTINATSTLGLQATYSWAKIHPSIAKYRNSGLSHDKHLLDSDMNYLQWNYDSRLSLLKGLLDSDGAVGNCKDLRQRNSFGSTSAALANLVKDLVRSLGGRCTDESSYSYDYQTYKSGSIKILRFRMPVCPFQIKSADWKSNTFSMASTINSIAKLNLQGSVVTPIVNTMGSLYVTDGYKLVSSNTPSQI